MNVTVSVRNLVEFLLRNGDIDNRGTASPADAMQQGSRIHRKIQRQMGANYHAEVTMKESIRAGEYDILVEGRADGIYEEPPARYYVDEIKGTYREIQKITDADPLHLAQAKCYAAMYVKQNQLESVGVRVTYCNLDTEEIRYFHKTLSAEELREWFEALVLEYKKWTDVEFQWRTIRTESIQKMQFPFAYRQGQKELVTYTYQTIYHGRKLFIEAPTGVGKTISTVFPAIKAMGENLAEKIFYLTAKTITRTVAENTIQLLRAQGLQLKSITLTAKEKICFQEAVECNPEVCPYARGHYDRINEAIYDLITGEQVFTREILETYARKHMVCPFEFSLDVSLFADALICDYNYLFDPHVYLKRFFAEDTKRDYLFLIDEAHNLLDRGRSMYSATLCKEDFLELKRECKDSNRKLEKQLERCNRELLSMKRMCTSLLMDPLIDTFARETLRLAATMEEYLEEQGHGEIREKVLDFYFEISHFNMIYELLDSKYVTYAEYDEEGKFYLRLFNVDPSSNLKRCMERGRSSILFSATFLPIQYYKGLLGGTAEDYEVYAQSTFNPAKRGLFIAGDVTSKYTRRNEAEYRRIAEYIYRITRERAGNYLIFFPSHQFMNRVYQIYEREFWNSSSGVELLVQENGMSEEKREAFLKRFEGNPELDMEALINFPIEREADNSLLGFCVMGGLFSEGIDLKHDALIGAIVVGTGLPQVCNENEILKEYFHAQGKNGFDYAYRFPGMNKVLQASGRVIRTHEDVGIVALLDERFQEYSYRRMFPREWENYEIVQLDRIGKRVERFWNEWL